MICETLYQFLHSILNTPLLKLFYSTFSDKPWLCFLRRPVILIIRLIFFRNDRLSLHIFVAYINAPFVKCRRIHNTHTVQLLYRTSSVNSHTHNFIYILTNFYLYYRISFFLSSATFWIAEYQKVELLWLFHSITLGRKNATLFPIFFVLRSVDYLIY